MFVDLRSRNSKTTTHAQHSHKSLSKVDNWSMSQDECETVVNLRKPIHVHLLLFGNSKWGMPATPGSVPTEDKPKSHDIFSCCDGTQAPGVLRCSFNSVTKLDQVVTLLTCRLSVSARTSTTLRFSTVVRDKRRDSIPNWVMVTSIYNLCISLSTIVLLPCTIHSQILNISSNEP